jgi:hypothetical protein
LVGGAIISVISVIAMARWERYLADPWRRGDGTP